jgi:hypothetical protein
MPENIKAKSKRGGHRPGAGRPKGVINRATREQKGRIEDLAKAHSPKALKTLVDVAEKGVSESARVTAATALLDRAYGRPRQSHEHTGADGGPIEYANLSDEELEARIVARITGKPDRNSLTTH